MRRLFGNCHTCICNRFRYILATTLCPVLHSSHSYFILTTSRSKLTKLSFGIFWNQATGLGRWFCRESTSMRTWVSVFRTHIKVRCSNPRASTARWQAETEVLQVCRPAHLALAVRTTKETGLKQVEGPDIPVVLWPPHPSIGSMCLYSHMTLCAHTMHVHVIHKMIKSNKIKL